MHPLPPPTSSLSIPALPPALRREGGSDSSSQDLASRRHLLLLAGGGCAALLLAGCASPAHTARRRSSGTSPGTLRTDYPSIALLHPLQFSGNLREAAIARAMLAINTPYTYGGNTLEGGFDCSGLVQYVFSGIAPRALPRSTLQWAQSSRPLAVNQLQRGDLVFFDTSGSPFSHMGIYIGRREFIHAPSSGGIVRTASLYSPYFASRFNGARTVFRG